MKNPLAKKILFLKVKQKDSDAFGEFYDLYINRIYRFIFFKVSSASDAQDLTSETFLKLWQSIQGGTDIKNLNSFVYMIARNSVIDFYRQRSRDEEVKIDNEHLLNISDDRGFLREQLKASDMKQVLNRLEHLKDEYKEVIVLRFLDELSIGEIADVLNKSKGAVRVLIHRALKVLKDSLNEKSQPN